MCNQAMSDRRAYIVKETILDPNLPLSHNRNNRTGKLTLGDSEQSLEPLSTTIISASSGAAFAKDAATDSRLAGMA
jgi:hypothetical protein